jgi:hypothetical protein
VRRLWNILKTAAGWTPLRPRTIIAAALLLWVYQYYGVERADLVLLVVGVGGLALLGIAVLAVTVVAIGFRLHGGPPAEDPWTFSVGTPFRTGYRLAIGAWIPLVQIDIEWVRPEGIDVRFVPSRGRLVEEVIAHRRCVTDHVVRRYRFTDAFGLARISFELATPQALKAVSARARLRSAEIFRQLTSGDAVSHPMGEPQGDFIDMRPYTPGDPLKQILWKAYARTRKLLVRVPERAIAPRQKTLAYLVSHGSDEAAAGTARTALEQGVFGRDFVFCADGESTTATQVSEALEQIVRSWSATESGGEGLGPFLEREGQGGGKSCIVFAPAQPGPWLDKVEVQARSRRAALSVLVGVDGLRMQQGQSMLARLMIAGAGEHRERIRGLRQVCDRLAATGVPVLVVDRAAGVPVHPRHLKLLEGRR